MPLFGLCLANESNEPEWATTWGLSTNQLYIIQFRVSIYVYNRLYISIIFIFAKLFVYFYTRCISVISSGCCITLGRTGNWNTSRPLPTGKLRTLRPMSWSQLPLGKEEFVATTFLGTWDFHFYRVILWTRYLGIFQNTTIWSFCMCFVGFCLWRLTQEELSDPKLKDEIVLKNRDSDSISMIG